LSSSIMWCQWILLDITAGGSCGTSKN
jgi:hypothetical protein